MGGITLSLSGTLLVHRMFGLHYPMDFGGKVAVSCLPMAVYFLMGDRVDLNWHGFVGFVAYAVGAFFLLFKLQGGLCEADRTLLVKSGIPKIRLILKLV